MRRLERPAWILSATFVYAVVLGLNSVASASDNVWIGPDLGNWNTGTNWANGVAPDVGFNEAAAINNNTTAVLSAPTMSQGAPVNVGGVKLGQAAGNVGGLRIASGGSLINVAGVSETGAIAVGVAGQGNLTVLGGGTISGTSLSLAGGTGSSITLGDNSGLTAALSTTGAATLGRTTTVHGKFVNFNIGGNVALSGTSTLIAEINDAAAHSPLKSTGSVALGGTFRPTFTGVTPGAGNSWNIVDATGITGSFSTFDTSAAPGLAAGQSYQLVQANGGVNGKLLKLSIEEILTLQVNRTTGAVSIANIGATSKILDGYSILSSRGSLIGSFNSLQDQAVAGWVEAGGTANDLSELNPGGSSTLNAGGSFALGTPYTAQYPSLGTDPDDVTFEYSTPDGRTIQGSVVYSGTKINNNLIVNVNPANGQAQLKNDSPFTIQLDGYAVYSNSGSLQPANGKWFSLKDRGVTGWDEALPTTTAVSELNQNGSLTLTPGSGYDLGELYKSVGGTQDLRLEFLQTGQDLQTNGLVVYGAFGSVPPPGLDGDYNNNGVVDAADYVLWRNNNINGAAGYTTWRQNFGKPPGSGSGQNAAAVPEPNAICLALTLICTAFGAVQRNSSRS